ncbi:MAG: type II toxin-antitoxin system RelE/ParE family toxin [Hyphomicrobium sp.]|jgi:toxin ParE1/3/4
MPGFRLSERAEADLVVIFDYTLQAFGAFQAEAYVEGLKRSCGLIVDFPGIGTAADELLPGMRRFRFQSHLIFYSVVNEVVVVRAFVHARRSVRGELFE